ncbi:MAG TPA: hypothetical protein ENJ29_14440 [Bacteroidetes bacterium]|nr:hypothetical protein [Bacteroidota bacterium]
MRASLNQFHTALLFLISATTFAFTQGPSAGERTHQLVARIDGQASYLSASYADGDERFPYIPLRELAEILDARYYFSQKTRKGIFYLGQNQLVVTAMNPFILINERVIQMPIPVRYEKESGLLVPVPFFIDHLARLYPGSLTVAADVRNSELAYREDSAPSPAETEMIAEPADTLKAEKQQVEVLSLSIEQKTNGTLIKIKTSAPVDASHINSRITRGWFYVDVYGATIDTLSVGISNESRFIREIVPVHLPQMAQLSFRLAGKLKQRKVFTDSRNNLILVSLTTEEKVSADVLKSLEEERKKWLIDTIVIDPGHGGRDPGAIGPTGVYEKDVTLDIARHLKRLIERNSDMRVVMTREEDRFIPLQARTHLANQEQGKLFISIHANSNKNPAVHGLTTYFLGQAKTEEALEVARRENAVINYEQDRSAYEEFNAENFILLSMAQNSYQQESEELAALVQQETTKKTGSKNRGVKQAGYYVLIGASMPNILVETAFISNRREEKLLKSYKFQKNIAEGIFNSLMLFKKKYERGI